MIGESAPALRISGYSHITPLRASGGSSALFSAVRETVGDRVAIKLISAAVATPQAQMHFDREREALQKLRDVGGIIALFDWGVAEHGAWYLVMPLLDRSLEDVLETRGPLSQPRMALIMSRIAEAVASAHGAGVLHRDIKPANILLTQEGAPYLADFGIARMKAGSKTTDAGTSLTPDYAPPEIVHGLQPSEATDVYSLGMTCWAVMVGRSPLRRNANESHFAVLERIANGPCPDPAQFGIGGEVCDLLRQATARNPADRFPASHFAQSLRALLPVGVGQSSAGQSTAAAPRANEPMSSPRSLGTALHRFGPGPPVYQRHG